MTQGIIRAVAERLLNLVPHTRTHTQVGPVPATSQTMHALLVFSRFTG